MPLPKVAITLAPLVDHANEAIGMCRGGTDEEQAAFVRRLGELTEGIPLALAIWSFPHDIGPSAGPPSFESISLRENDGTPKPALAAWQALVAAS